MMDIQFFEAFFFFFKFLSNKADAVSSEGPLRHYWTETRSNISADVNVFLRW